MLSQYPHLHHVLRNDPVANAQFNAAMSGLAPQRTSGESPEARLEKSLNHARERANVLSVEVGQLKQTNEKLVKFVRVLGETIEAQLDLQPWTLDDMEERKYNIAFKPDRVRMALRLYWDAVAKTMEDSITRTLVVHDPAAERATEEELDD
jgi:hypothetical protein